ncbi:hypothetical protein ACFFX0_19050 [Citricoccus parietis]|uniref:Uncharacterized protein n=1 Tax=Citricoccus parietis TaxID=592307 RepID=A0ABV5G2L7_9MICC
MRSAAVPAPPVGSVPAIESTRGTAGRAELGENWVGQEEVTRTSLR